MMYIRYPSFVQRSYRDQEPFRVSIRDEGDHIDLYAELAGLEKEDIRVTYDEGILTIGASAQLLNNMHNRSDISRSFRFENVDETRISAEFRNGMLHICLPKDGIRGRTIEIQ